MGGGRRRRLALLPPVLVFVVLAAVEIAPRAAATRPTPTPTPSPPPSPAPDFGRVRPNLDVFWIVGRDSRWMVAFDWSGQPAGTLQRVASSVSPDGQRLYSDGAFIDAQGDFLAKPELPGENFTWSTASDGVCGYGGGLWTYRLGGAGARLVHAMADPEGAVAACSFARDLALVASGAPEKPRTLSWIRLHDGALLAHRSYPPDDLGDVVVSRDFRYFAENFYSLSRPATYGVPPSVIREVNGGGEVAGRGDVVTAFSADDREVATVLIGGGVVGVFRLTTNPTESVWQAGGGEMPDLYPAPSGAEFVGERVVAGALSLVLVHGDGSAQTLAAPAFDSLLKPG
jgi:hypothetical protein